MTADLIHNALYRRPDLLTCQTARNDSHLPMIAGLLALPVPLVLMTFPGALAVIDKSTRETLYQALI